MFKSKAIKKLTWCFRTDTKYVAFSRCSEVYGSNLHGMVRIVDLLSIIPGVVHFLL